MTKTISIISQKEGVGKTTIAANIAATLALYEKKTLLIDGDPQSHLTRYAGIRPMEITDTLYHAFMGKASAGQVAVQTPIAYLTFIPSGPSLFLTEHRLAIKPGKELILKKIIQEIKNDFQYVIIDSPSSLGFFTICAMAASDWSILPAACNVSTREALSDLDEIIKMVQDQLNPDLKIAGTLWNMCSGKDGPDRFLSEGERKQIPYPSFKTTIPRDDMVQKASRSGKPVALCDIRSEAAQAYFDFSVELLKKIA
ncbi:MAG: ParA family protein [Desulfobacteraceae bacterium]|nr:MAG: ParA family protein [Desulfobacteraceae bacterium]